MEAHRRSRNVMENHKDITYCKLDPRSGNIEVERGQGIPYGYMTYHGQGQRTLTMSLETSEY